jgi:hypothetical protein
MKFMEKKPGRGMRRIITAPLTAERKDDQEMMAAWGVVRIRKVILQIKSKQRARIFPSG